MKTKNLLYLLLFALILPFASCSDDNKNHYIKHDELPEATLTFLDKYLPNNKFISAQKDDYGVYIVNLEGDIETMFSLNGKWQYLLSEKGLPETTKELLSENSQKELKKKYPSAKTTSIYNYNSRVHIALDSKKTLCDIIGHEGDVLAEIVDRDGITALPQKMKIFLNKFMNSNLRDVQALPHILKFNGFRGVIYRWETADGSIDFYEDGEWFYIKEVESKTVSKFMGKAISEDMINVLVTNVPNSISSLLSITRFNNNTLYGFDLGNNKFIVINSENKVIEPPLDKAKEYIKQTFNPETELQYEVRSNTSSPYFLRYAFIATGQGVISLVTDIEGNMRVVSAGAITTETGKTTPLPKAVFKMLPNGITTYLDANYPNKDILQISHSYSVKQDDIPGEINLTMPIPNNLKVLIFNSSTGEFIKEYTVINQ